MKQILTDIIGTTSPYSFVKTLMQDFKKNGADSLAGAGPDLLRTLDKIRKETGLQTGEEIVDYISEQIDQENLRPEYMALYGWVNADGYSKGRLQGEFFSDVPTSFKRWQENGKGIFVYSHASEAAQKAMFKTAKEGDLSKYISGFFDTAIVGYKDESDSYKEIARELRTHPRDILFLSDLEIELDAAKKSGCEVKLVLREGNKPIKNQNRYPVVKSFEEI